MPIPMLFFKKRRQRKWLFSLFRLTNTIRFDILYEIYLNEKCVERENALSDRWHRKLLVAEKQRT
ncbi:MAG TPA: hypothetical protein DD734_10640 [Firmicutes bacterium]|nr:hypothetical protein [Bacillota bacterium]